MLGHVVSLTIHARMGYRYRRFTPSERFSRKEAARHGGVRCSLARFIGYALEYTRGYSTRLYFRKINLVNLSDLINEML